MVHWKVLLGENRNGILRFLGKTRDGVKPIDKKYKQ